MDAWDAVGLLVLLRLWRVVRIVNGMFGIGRSFSPNSFKRTILYYFTLCHARRFYSSVGEPYPSLNGLNHVNFDKNMWIRFFCKGIVLSVKIEMDEKMHHLKEEIDELQTQLEHYKNRCKEQEVMVDTNDLIEHLICHFVSKWQAIQLILRFRSWLHVSH